jgi:hypothetical protein
MLEEFCPQVHLTGELIIADPGKKLILEKKPELVFSILKCLWKRV